MTDGRDVTRERAALLAVQLLFGAHYLAAKWVVAELAPPAWALLRVLASAAVFLLLFVLGRRRWPTARDCGYLLVCALFGIALNQALFLEGIARTTVAHSALINSQIPTFALLFAVLLRQERLTVRTGAGFACGIAGVLVLLEVDRMQVAPATLGGDLLNVGNAASYGLFVAISKRAMSRLDPLAASAVLFLGGAALMLPYGAGELWRADLGALSPRAIAAVAFTVLGATVLTYFLNLWALKRAAVSRVAIYIFLQPVIAAALGVLLMHERLSLRFYAATALVLAALFLRDSRRARLRGLSAQTRKQPSAPPSGGSSTPPGHGRPRSAA